MGSQRVGYDLATKNIPTKSKLIIARGGARRAQRRWGEGGVWQGMRMSTCEPRIQDRRAPPGAGRGRGTLLQVPRERGPAHTSTSASWPLELRKSLFLLFGVLFQCRGGGGALELAVLARKAK